jgi:hypothetical protein
MDLTVKYSTSPYTSATRQIIYNLDYPCRAATITAGPDHKVDYAIGSPYVVVDITKFF